MAGYNPSMKPADYVVDPTVRKSMDEWAEILWKDGSPPWWWRIAKLMVNLGFAVKSGRLVYDRKAYRHS